MRSSVDQPREYGSQIETAVKPILALTEIAVTVFFKAKCMVSARNSSLYVSKYGINPFEALHAIAFTALSNNFTLMKVTGLGYC
jgi:hypothetical protein